MTRSGFRSILSASLIVLLLILAPFAVAQDVHHELAAADTDGHEHSDTDLCQWVQHHSSGSLDTGGTVFSTWDLIGEYKHASTSVLLSLAFPFLGPSRAPPQI